MTLILEHTFAVLVAVLVTVLVAQIVAHLILDVDPRPAERPHVVAAPPVPVLVEVADDRPMLPAAPPDLHPLTRPLTPREVNRTPALIWAEVVGRTGVLA